MAARDRLEVQKLALEVRQLRHANSPLGIAATLIIPVFVSTVTAFVAMLGIAISLYTLQQQRSIQFSQERNKALQVALDMATDPKENADRQISGVYQLEAFWNDPADEQVVGATLAALLVVPQSSEAPRVRCAAAQSVSAAFSDPGTDEAERHRIARLLFGAPDGSLGLVSQENWLLTQRAGARRTPNDSRLATVDCDSPVDATREAIRKSWAYLQGANLNGNDLSYAQLYEADLHGALLLHARLIATNLKCANLNNVSMQGFRRSDRPILWLATVANEPDSKSFVADAIANHAISITNDQWRAWETAHFSGYTLKRLMGSRFPRWVDPSSVAKKCHVAGDAAWLSSQEGEDYKQ
ncbi:MAG TPA: pentapeptide repeat-containing protein [Candidatus Cybelea sp.]|jgi:hypothetical protein|nr:pentapeptide repeat-containing protein [Candidatus Cybelea sp.]